MNGIERTTQRDVHARQLRGRNLKRLEPGADEGGLAVALGAVFLAVVGFVGLIASLLVFVIAVDRDLDRLRVAVGGLAAEPPVEVEHGVELPLNVADDTLHQLARRDRLVFVGVVARAARLSLVAVDGTLVVELRKRLADRARVEPGAVGDLVAGAVRVVAEEDVNPRAGLGVEQPRQEIDDVVVEPLDGLVRALAEPFFGLPQLLAGSLRR